MFDDLHNGNYKQYNKDKELVNLEAGAKQRKVGLWVQENPVASWDFRKIKRVKK